MSTNFHTAWQDGVTEYKASDMNDPLSDLDQKITSMDAKVWWIAGNYLNAKPPNSALLIRIIIGRYMELADGAPGSYAGCGVAPTAESVLSIKKNGNQVGTITIAGSATTGSFSVSGDKRWYPGDVLSVEAPASQDTTLQDISVTLRLSCASSYETTTTTTTQTTTTTTTTSTTTTT